jgi:hypothetical protein
MIEIDPGDLPASFFNEMGDSNRKRGESASRKQRFAFPPF